VIKLLAAKVHLRLNLIRNSLLEILVLFLNTTDYYVFTYSSSVTIHKLFILGISTPYCQLSDVYTNKLGEFFTKDITNAINALIYARN